MISLKNHISINLTPEVIELCRPLKKLNIDFFCFHRVFSDGSEVMLSSSGVWAEHFHRAGYSTYSSLQYILRNGFEYYVWPNTHLKSSALGLLRDFENVHHGMTIITKYNENAGYIDAFGFALSKNLEIDVVMNSIDLLKHFSVYFAHQATSIINRCKNHKIIPQSSDIIFLANNNNANTIIPIDRRGFLSQTCGNISFSQKFTKKELRCIDHLLLGKTANEIARILNLSPRTVEGHLNNLKNKLGCYKKSELIATLFKKGFLPHQELLP